MSASIALPRTSHRTAVGRAAAELHRRLGLEIRRLRSDAGLSIRQVAAAAGIDFGYLAQIESGAREPSFAVLIAIGDVLGADLSIHFYPTTGPRIRDRVQAAVIEALFEALDPRWKRLAEVPVRRPARGYIDAVLAHPSGSVVVATEAQSEIRRLEQQLRWAGDKAESLASSSVWSVLAPADEPPPRVSRLLLVRSTPATREVARAYRETLSTTYPARAEAVYASLTSSNEPWPGAGLLWAVVEGGRGRLLPRPPRGVDLGR